MTLKQVLKKVKLSEQTISTILGGLVIIVIGILVFNYFRGVNNASQSTVTPTVTQLREGGSVALKEEGGKMVPSGLPTTHTVAKGESLWKISEKYFGTGYNWTDIAKANNLKNPNILSEGQKLSIPKTEVKGTTTLTAASTSKISVGEPISGASYTVVKGDSLWKIAVRAYQDGYKWPEIAKANKLANPSVIHSGVVLTIPRK